MTNDGGAPRRSRREFLRRALRAGAYAAPIVTAMSVSRAHAQPGPPSWAMMMSLPPGQQMM